MARDRRREPDASLVADWDPSGRQWKQYFRAYRRFCELRSVPSDALDDGAEASDPWVPDDYVQPRTRYPLGALTRQLETLYEVLDVAILEALPGFHWPDDDVAKHHTRSDTTMTEHLHLDDPEGGSEAEPGTTREEQRAAAIASERARQLEADVAAIRNRHTRPAIAADAAERQWVDMMTGTMPVVSAVALRDAGLRTVTGRDALEQWLRFGFDALETFRTQGPNAALSERAYVLIDGRPSFRLGRWRAAAIEAVRDGLIDADAIPYRYRRDIPVDHAGRDAEIEQQADDGLKHGERRRREVVAMADEAIAAAEARFAATGSVGTSAKANFTFGAGHSWFEAAKGLRQHRRSLTVAQLERLDAIDFPWGKGEQAWRANYAMLRELCPDGVTNGVSFEGLKAETADVSIPFASWFDRQVVALNRPGSDPQHHALFVAAGVVLTPHRVLPELGAATPDAGRAAPSTSR